MKGHLLHNIHNNDNKIESKIKKSKNSFYHQSRAKKKALSLVYYQFVFLLSSVDVVE